MRFEEFNLILADTHFTGCKESRVLDFTFQNPAGFGLMVYST